MSEIRVLIAEDHRLMREGIRRLLQQEEGLVLVGEASDGEEAIKLASQLKPDVIIMDVAMPRVNGIEATKAIKAQYPNIAVLILSAHDNDEYVFALLEAGAAGYLLKSASGDELVNAIRSVHSGEPVLHPSVLQKVMNYFLHDSRPARQEQPSTPLTEREKEVLLLAARGMSNKSIASELSLSTRTVEGYLRSVFNKVGVGSRTEAVLYALRKGWLKLDEPP